MRRPERVLVIYLKRIGDILLTTPAVAWLRRALPQAKIDFLVYPQYAELLTGNPHLDDVLSYPVDAPWKLPSLLRPRRYDWTVDFLANGGSAWASFLSGASHRIAFDNGYPFFIHNVKIGRPDKPVYSAFLKIHLLEELFKRVKPPVGENPRPSLRPELFIEEERKKEWRLTLEQGGFLKGPLVMLSPQSLRETRRWSLEGYAAVARELASRHGCQVLCLWGPGEKETAERVVSLAGQAGVRMGPQFKSLKDLAAALSHASCLITNCNGTRHVATAMQVPTVTVHMSSDPVVWNLPNPDGPGFHPKHPVVRAEGLWCIACMKNVCPYKLECSTLVEPAVVARKALELIG